MPEEICLCSLKGTIDVIARKWSLFVLNLIGNNGRLRFNELMTSLPGISPTTLTETLTKLVSMGLIRRETFPEIPPRAEYSLTEEGTSLRNAIHPLLIWAANKDPAKGLDPGCPVFARVPACP
jgi:DNA-binding HxlR family transcriptional regulator